MTEEKQNMWAEKYRPESFDEMIGQDKNIKKIKGLIEKEKKGKDELPHLLFSGPSGTGKTTTAKIIARELYGDRWRDNLLDMNASDERGIDVVRNKIKKYSKQSTFSGNYKLIFLDEVDNLTDASLSALRRVMEDYVENVRFILSCNYPSNIIDPIRGRCAIFRFGPVSKAKLADHLRYIADEEGLDYESGSLQLLAKKSDNTRSALQNLQADSEVGTINEEWVRDQTSGITHEELGRIFSMLEGNEGKDVKMKRIDEEVAKLYQNGVSAQEILGEFYDFVLNEHPEMVKTLAKVGDIDAHISNGAQPMLQIRAFFAWLIGRLE